MSRGWAAQRRYNRWGRELLLVLNAPIDVRVGELAHPVQPEIIIVVLWESP